METVEKIEIRYRAIGQYADGSGMYYAPEAKTPREAIVNLISKKEDMARYINIMVVKEITKRKTISEVLDIPISELINIS